MEIRRAEARDIPRLEELLLQVNLVHHEGRPDLFRVGTKYTEEELEALLLDEERPILVATDERDRVLGYCFGIIQQKNNDNILTDVKTFYIDDLCVDENTRGQHVGRTLYEAALALAKELGCYNLTLNVWSCNASAMQFYEKLGLVPQKIGMEQILT